MDRRSEAKGANDAGTRCIQLSVLVDASRVLFAPICPKFSGTRAATHVHGRRQSARTRLCRLSNANAHSATTHDLPQ